MTMCFSALWSLAPLGADVSWTLANIRIAGFWTHSGMGLGKGGVTSELTFLPSSWVMLLQLRLGPADPQGTDNSYGTNAPAWHCKHAVLSTACLSGVVCFHQFLALFNPSVLLHLTQHFPSSLFAPVSFCPNPFPILFQDQILPSRIQKLFWSLPSSVLLE